MPAPGACILAPLGTSLQADEAAFFRAADPWGFILFSRNVEDPAQLVRLTASLRETVGREAPILIDQEGGRVQRLRPPHWRDWLPPQDEVTRAGPHAARVLWLRGALIGAELRAVGIDVNCMPCADVAGPATHPFLRNRCLGTDPAQVAALAGALAEGQMAAGCLPVLKHIPGHGAATADSHHALPVVDDPAEVLDARDFAPFRALSDLPLGMTAHVVYSALDPAPATLAPRVIALIRERIGFSGLLMSDDLSMEALDGTLGARSAASIAAGCDVVLYCKGILREAEEVAAAAGPMTPAALARGRAALDRRPPAGALDIAAADAEFLALTGQGAVT